MGRGWQLYQNQHCRRGLGIFIPGRVRGDPRFGSCGSVLYVQMQQPPFPENPPNHKISGANFYWKTGHFLCCKLTQNLILELFVKISTFSHNPCQVSRRVPNGDFSVFSRPAPSRSAPSLPAGVPHARFLRPDIRGSFSESC